MVPTRFLRALALGVAAVLLVAGPGASQLQPTANHTQDLRFDPGAFDQQWVEKARPLYEAKHQDRPDSIATIGVIVALLTVMGLLVCAGCKAKIWRNPSTLVNMDRLEFNAWLRVVTRWGSHW